MSQAHVRVPGLCGPPLLGRSFLRLLCLGRGSCPLRWPALQASPGARRLAEGPEGSPALRRGSWLSSLQPSGWEKLLGNRALVQQPAGRCSAGWEGRVKGAPWCLLRGCNNSDTAW